MKTLKNNHKKIVSYMLLFSMILQMMAGQTIVAKAAETHNVYVASEDGVTYSVSATSVAEGDTFTITATAGSHTPDGIYLIDQETYEGFLDGTINTAYGNSITANFNSVCESYVYDTATVTMGTEDMYFYIGQAQTVSYTVNYQFETIDDKTGTNNAGYAQYDTNFNTSDKNYSETRTAGYGQTIKVNAPDNVDGYITPTAEIVTVHGVENVTFNYTLPVIHVTTGAGFYDDDGNLYYGPIYENALKYGGYLNIADNYLDTFNHLDKSKFPFSTAGDIMEYQGTVNGTAVYRDKDYTGNDLERVFVFDHYELNGEIFTPTETDAVGNYILRNYFTEGDIKTSFNSIFLIAVYKPVTYNVIYEGMDGATYETGKENPTTLETIDFGTFNEPIKPGYIFTGWTVSGTERTFSYSIGDYVYTEKDLVSTPTKLVGYSGKIDPGTGNPSWQSALYISDDLTLTAHWEEAPLTQYNYTVNHHIEKADGSYELKETESFTAYENEEVSPAVKSYNGFVSPSTQNVTITSEGQVIDYYYDLEAASGYTFTYDVEGYVGDDLTITGTDCTDIFNCINVTNGSKIPGGNSVELEISFTDTIYDSNGNSYSMSYKVTDDDGNTYTIYPSSFGGDFVNFTMPNNDLHLTITFKTQTGYKVINRYEQLDGTYTEETSFYTTHNYTTLYVGDTITVKPTKTVDILNSYALPSDQEITLGAADDNVVIFTYNLLTYTFVANKGTGIENVNGMGTYKVGQEATFTVDVADGYEFDGWYVPNTSTDVSYTNEHTFTVNYSNFRSEFDYPAGYMEKDAAGNYTITFDVKAKLGPTTYTVNHYTENADGTYTLENTETFNANVGSITAPINFIHSTADHYQASYGASYSEIVKENGATVIDVYYNRLKYVLTLNGNSGLSNISGAGTYRWGEEVTISADLADYYIFKGWTNSSVGVSNVKDFTFTMPTNTVTLNAETEAVKFNINYVLNGGTNHANNPATATHFQLVRLYNPTKEGYVFDGWTLNDGDTPVQYLDLTDLTSDVTVTAHWSEPVNTATSYTVKFFYEKLDGTYEENVDERLVFENVNIGNQVSYTIDTANEKEHYNLLDANGNTFNGSYRKYLTLDANSDNNVIEVYSNLETVTVEAMGDKGTLMLNNTRFDNGYGTITVKYGSTVTVSMVYDYGYELDYWSVVRPSNLTVDDIGYVNSSGSIVIPVITEDISLNCKYKYISRNYNVHYFLENANGSYDESTSDSYQHYINLVDGMSIYPNEKSFDGYITPEIDYVDITVDGQDINLYYERESYNVTLNKGTGISSTNGAGNYKWGTTVAISATLQNDYVFDGWYDEDGNLVSNNSSFTYTVPKENSTLTAKATYAVVSYNYTVETYLMDASGNYPTTASDTKTLTSATLDVEYVPEAIAKYITPANQTVTINADGSSVIKLYYERTKHTLTIRGDEGISSFSDISGEYYWGAFLMTNTLSVKPGYEFIGWYDEDELYSNSRFPVINMPASDLTITAKTIRESVTASYTVNHHLMNLDGSTYTLKDTDSYNAEALSSVSPSVKTYIGFTSPVVQTVTVAADGSTVIDYYYTRNQYTVTINEDTGINKTTGEGTYYYGQEVNVSATVKETYAFSGWFKNNNVIFSKTNYTFTMPAENVVLTAKAVKNNSTEKPVITVFDSGKNATIEAGAIKNDTLDKIYYRINKGEWKVYNGKFDVPVTYEIEAYQTTKGGLTSDIAKVSGVRTVTISGKLTYADGTPIANKLVEIHSTPRYVMTDANGYYEINDVEIGDHTFKIFNGTTTDAEVLVSADIVVSANADNDSVDEKGSEGCVAYSNIDSENNLIIIDGMLVGDPEDPEPTIPQTGDSSNLTFYVVLMLVSLVSLILLSKKKRFI